jgi:hypothetical protein
VRDLNLQLIDGALTFGRLLGRHRNNEALKRESIGQSALRQLFRAPM